MTYRKIIGMIEKDGWYLIRQRGSHRHYKHSSKKGLVTIAHHGIKKTVSPKILKLKLKQAGIGKSEIL